MTGQTLTVIKKGDNTTTVNSPAQTILLPARPAAPATLTTTNATTVGGNGSIDGTATTMQYSADSITWAACAATTTALAPGTWHIRLTETSTDFRSQAVTLKIFLVETLPSTVIDFANETLNGFYKHADSIYLLSFNGEPAIEVSDTAYVPVPDEWMTGQTLTVIKKGDNTTTVNSPVQTILLPARPAAPALTVTHATTVGGNGSIDGTATTMQYSADSITWAACAATTTALAPGTWHVRITETSSNFRSQAVTLKILPVEAPPSIAIDFTDEILTGFDPGNIYYVISAASDTTTLTGVATLNIPNGWMTGETFNIVKKGNGTTTVNSPAQPLPIPARPAAPAPDITEETVYSGNDGHIYNIPPGTEYSADNGQTWHSITGTQLTGLPPGDYLIREKATGGSFAGQPVAVTLRTMPRIDFSPEQYVFADSYYILPAVTTSPAGLTVHFSLRPEDARMASVTGGILHVLFAGVIELTAYTDATASCQPARLTVRITASDPPVPAIMREVVLPQVEGATTSPPAGTYRVESGRDFTFTLAPAADRAFSAVPEISADRPNGSGVTVTPNGDGTYAVRIHAIHRSITVGIDAPTDITSNDNMPAADRVWTAAGHLYLVSAVTGDAKVYNATGVMVKIIHCVEGETVRVPLSAGLHVVIMPGGTVRKVII
jgi:hypothetical protein